ncbi:MAG: hypothetical protein JWO76_2679 [Nocardioides sp.]|nr:hypothetical protein [Nocardioides sp.]
MRLHASRTRTTLSGLLTAGLMTVAAPVSAAEPAPVTQLRPAHLDRGADEALPHLDGSTIVDGDLRIPVRAGWFRLLGRSGDAYVVRASNPGGTAHVRIVRVRTDGSARVLGRGSRLYDGILSDEGDRVVAAWPARRGDTRVRVLDARTGRLVLSRLFGGDVAVLDAAGHRVLLGGSGPARTLWWDTERDRAQRVLGRTGYVADIRADRFATFTRPAELGGCSVVRSLSTPREVLWRSCRERVQAFAPGGRRLATFPIDLTGAAADVHVRRIHGGDLAHYRTGFFGRVRWETGSRLLLDTTRRGASAVVRCRLADCERASDVVAVEY